jgi:cobalamin biosynthesis protein CbiG
MRELAAVASIDSRRGEAAILAAAASFSVPAVFFDAPRLERETPRLKNPSAIVFARVGCHGVAEAAALAAAGPTAELVLAKIKSARATAAIARILLQKA